MATIRPAGPDDAAAYLAVRNTVMPYLVNSVDGLCHNWTRSEAFLAGKTAVFLAEDAGETVGYGRAGLNMWTSEPGAGEAVFGVRPDRRGQGIGRALLEWTQTHLHEIGTRSFVCWSRDDDASLAFMARHGFEHTLSDRMSALDLTTATLPPMPPIPAGVAIATTAEIGAAAVYAVDSETIQDEPGQVVMDAVPFDQWVSQVWDTPEVLHDASVGVLVDGICVAYTLVLADLATGRAWSAGTGTLRAHRGRGYAKLAKSVSLRLAADRGVRVAYTGNGESNRAMLAVNEWLGYRPVATEWTWRKTLSRHD